MLKVPIDDDINFSGEPDQVVLGRIVVDVFQSANHPFMWVRSFRVCCCFEGLREVEQHGVHSNMSPANNSQSRWLSVLQTT